MISPSITIRNLIVAQGLMTLPTAAGTWPVYRENLPDGPGIANNVGCVFDTPGTKDGRYMRTGKVVEHYGVQLRIESDDGTGWAKANDVAVALDALTNEVVGAYTVNNISRSGPVISLGKKEGTTRTSVHVVNFMATIT